MTDWHGVWLDLMMDSRSVDDYCEGCGAVVDQEHLRRCSVWAGQREER